jgi:hypothetical protein
MTSKVPKVKASPSLKGILKEELREEIRNGHSETAVYTDRAVGDLENKLREQFRAADDRLWQLEKYISAPKETSFWDDNYYLILISIVIVYLVILIVLKMQDQ